MLRKALLIVPFVLLLLILPASAAASSSSQIISLADSLALASIAILFSLSLVALSYMLGEVLRIESLKRWYKGELWETAKSALIIISVFAILIIAGGIADALAGNTANFSLSGNIITASSQIQSNLLGLANTANSYVQAETVNIQDAFNVLYGLSYGVDFLKSLSLSLWIPIPIPIPPPEFMGFMSGSTSSIYVSSTIATALAGSQSLIADYSTVIMLPLLIVFTIQEEYLLVIISLGLGLFLPLGVILRAIPVLRPLGGTFIAIGIGISIVYPTLLVAFNLPVSNFVNGIFVPPPPVPTTVSVPPPLLRYGPLFSSILSYSSSPNPSFGTGFSSGLSAIVSVYGPINTISYTLVNALTQFLLLIFDLVLGLVITGDIARLLGGRLPTGIGKFKIA